MHEATFVNAGLNFLANRIGATVILTKMSRASEMTFPAERPDEAKSNAIETATEHWDSDPGESGLNLLISVLEIFPRAR